MNYFVISDIHGSASQLEKALSIYHQDNYQALIILGDILYHGPRNDLPIGYEPKKVIDLLNDLKEEIIAVKGNCDGEVDQMVLQFPILGTYNQLFLNDRKVFLTHGHIITPEQLPPLKEGSVYLYGHVHLPIAEKKETVIHCNPGSISIPKGGYPASYAILNEKGFTIYSLEDQNIIKSIEY